MKATSNNAAASSIKRTNSDSPGYFNLQKQPEMEVVQQQEKGSVSTCPNSKTVSNLVDAAQTVVFTSLSLQRTINRCLSDIGNESLVVAFSTLLQKSKASTEKLMRTLDLIDNEPTPKLVQELLQTISLCVTNLKDVCSNLRTRLSVLVQGFDAKHSRHLLSGVYNASVDIKSAWETVRPYLTVDPSHTLVSLRSANATPNTTPLRYRSQHEFKGSSAPILPSVRPDNSQLYMQLKNLVSSSLNVIGLLTQAIGETLQATQQTEGAALGNKLNGLLRQTQYATDLSQLLSKHLEVLVGMSSEELSALPTRKELSRRIWDDTSMFLKAIVSVMTSIRSISTEEEFQWSKAIKQGCLYITRMTAEVAKLWNHYSTFAEDGYFLGRHSAVTNASTPSSSTATTPAASTGTPSSITVENTVQRKASGFNTSEQSEQPATTVTTTTIHNNIPKQ